VPIFAFGSFARAAASPVDPARTPILTSARLTSCAARSLRTTSSICESAYGTEKSTTSARCGVIE